jgi:hypothetical protein
MRGGWRIRHEVGGKLAKVVEGTRTGGTRVSDRSIDDRKFTEREVREILRQAVRKAPSRDLLKSEGLSLGELKSIGGEVGIDPGRLEDAARSVMRGSGRKVNPILGGPTVLDFERRVEGKIDPEDTPGILAMIRRAMGHQGEVAEIRGSLEWSSTTESGARHVTVSTRDGITTVRGSANLSSAAVLCYMPGSVLGLIGSGVGFLVSAKNGNAVGMAAFAAILPSLYLAFRGLFRRITKTETARLEGVVNEVARLAEGSDG